MKAYQCSRCRQLEEDDFEEKCFCSAGIDMRPQYRYKGLANECKAEFQPLDEDKIWHNKFRWEK